MDAVEISIYDEVYFKFDKHETCQIWDHVKVSDPLQ